MKKLFLFLTCIIALSGCSATHAPSLHTIEIKDVDFSKADQIKEGKSCGVSLFGLIGPFGDAKLVDAIKDGNISKVVSYDVNYRHFILFSRSCFRAYGY